MISNRQENDGFIYKCIKSVEQHIDSKLKSVVKYTKKTTNMYLYLKKPNTHLYCIALE